MNRIVRLAFLFVVVLFSISGCGSEGGAKAVNADINTGGQSKSGSTAKMIIHQGALYFLEGGKLKVFDVRIPDDSRFVSDLWVPSFETAYVHDDHLYLGGQSGVSVYDVSSALDPIETSFYSHSWGCDPIVVDQGIGYVTLRNRGGCGGDANRLEVVDFSDPSEPIEITRFDMDKPYGLSFIGRYLAVCEEEFGLSILDVSLGKSAEGFTAEVEKLVEYNNIHCFDLIYHQENLIATASDGIYQFAVGDGYYLTELSRIPVGELEVKAQPE